jgi:hypothetical protein
MIKFNSFVTDSATGFKGIVDMLHFEIGGELTYRFQPSGLNPKSKEPLEHIWVKEGRLIGGERIPMPNYPLEVLNTEVEDIGTTFKGTAVSMAVHSTGCVHFNVQAKGKTEDGNAIKVQNFSILRLKGKAIKQLSETEAAKEREEKPSPGHCSMPTRMG